MSIFPAQTTVKEFAIDRRTWYRGQGGTGSLLREDGRRCCLGFYAAACGVPDAELAKVPLPSHIATVVSQMAWLLEYPDDEWDTRVEDYFVSLNDTHGLDESAREAGIAALFAAIGITVNFTD